MKALDFLHSKGIKRATCYTNKDTYYVNELSSLMEDYARLMIEQDRERVKDNTKTKTVDTRFGFITVVDTYSIDQTPIILT